jgi:sulfite exporter TauE/SafE
MIALFSAVLLASLLGSTHCAGMCGAFVAFAVGAPAGAQAKPVSRARLNAAYNGGRLVTYSVLGAIAGGLGAALNLGGSLMGVQKVAAGVAAGLMIGFGIVAVLRHLGMRIPRAPVPGVLIRLARAGHAWAFGLSPIQRASVVGLLTTLLPCGWLYAFVVIAAGTASPLAGAAVMATFWLGTLPVMAAIGLGVGSLAGPLRQKLPLVTSLVLIAAGVWTLLGRMAMPAMAASALVPPASVEQSIERAGDAEEACPLCAKKGH